MCVCISLHRWRLFRRPIISQPDMVVTYTKAAIALHDYLQTTEDSTPSPVCTPGFTDVEDEECNVIEGTWQTDDEQSTGMGPVACTSSMDIILPPPLLYIRHSRSTASIRDSYRDYFSSTQGEVSWQYTVRRTQ